MAVQYLRREASRPWPPAAEPTAEPRRDYATIARVTCWPRECWQHQRSGPSARRAPRVRGSLASSALVIWPGRASPTASPPRTHPSPSASNSLYTSVPSTLHSSARRSASVTDRRLLIHARYRVCRLERTNQMKPPPATELPATPCARPSDQRPPPGTRSRRTPRVPSPHLQVVPRDHRPAAIELQEPSLAGQGPDFAATRDLHCGCVQGIGAGARIGYEAGCAPLPDRHVLQSG
jgi:hypothetical protein